MPDNFLHLKMPEISYTLKMPEYFLHFENALHFENILHLKGARKFPTLEKCRKLSYTLKVNAYTMRMHFENDGYTSSTA